MDDPGRRRVIRRLAQGSKLWKGIHVYLAEAQTPVLGGDRKMGVLELIGRTSMKAAKKQHFYFDTLRERGGPFGQGR